MRSDRSVTAPEVFDTNRGALIAELSARFPEIPAASVIACVLDAADAVEYVQVAAAAREELVARLSRAHLDELAGFYPAHDADA